MVDGKVKVATARCSDILEDPLQLKDPQAIKQALCLSGGSPCQGFSLVRFLLVFLQGLAHASNVTVQYL